MVKHYLFRGILFSFILVCASCASYLKGSYTVEEKSILRNAQALGNAEDYVSALQQYRVVYNNHTDDGFLNYKMGECYLLQGMLTEALAHFDVAEAKNYNEEPMFFYRYGQVLHKTGKYKMAGEWYDKFLKTGKKEDLKYTKAEVARNQIQFALGALNTPVGAVVSNVGEAINSIYSDGLPSITADGKKMIFTSARIDGKGSMLVKDGNYFQDIYSSEWNDSTGKWSTAQMLEGEINSNEHDANTSISPDGQSIYMYKNVRIGKEKTASGDIYISTMGATGRWNRPTALSSVNSSYFESAACLSADGKRLFFVSERSDVLFKNYGKTDIFVSDIQPDGTWGKAVNLGPVVNTSEDEISLFIHPDGKTLFFSSTGHENNMGGYDIFKTVYENGVWSQPVNLGFPINTFRDERHFVLTTDGQRAYYTTQLEENRKDLDIYEIDLRHYNVLTGESDKLAILRGTIEDASTTKLLVAEIVVIDQTDNSVVNLKSDNFGAFFNTFVAGRSYKVEITKTGYKPFSHEIIMPAFDAKGTKELKLFLSLERIIPLTIVSKDLFKVQHMNFSSVKDSLVLTAFSEKLVALYAEQMKKEATLKLRLIGHASGENNDEASLEESKKYAEYIKNLLVAKGVNVLNIETIFAGSTEPVGDVSTEQGKAINRRVDVYMMEN